MDAGPDERPILVQLIEHARVIAGYFGEVQQGLALLQAAGIDRSRVYERSEPGKSEPFVAYRAFVAWLQRARDEGRLADCDIETVASTILGSLHGIASTADVCVEFTGPVNREDILERFINVLWHGIGVRVAEEDRSPAAPTDPSAHD
ncbi:MAG: hypothetical protein AAGF11_48185 [Myxococcota bacterium]